MLFRIDPAPLEGMCPHAGFDARGLPREGHSPVRKMDLQDTIAAIATPPGEGGIGIIRISGPAAREVALRVFRPAAASADAAERRLVYGTITGPRGEPGLDNGFLVLMKATRSYTGEDAAELHCHGGPLILKRALEAVVKNGARLAAPGEFTKRAFLNGKLDLAQAEAVIDLIRAKTGSALGSARGRMEGLLSRRINGIKEAVLGLLAGIEAGLDFPEDVSGPAEEAFMKGANAAREALSRLVSTYEEGRILRDGVGVLILGRPNVGKSSLLNCLLMEERAIVTPLPGTTRDVIEDYANIRGIPARLMDTAGLRESDDPVESIGVRAARERIKSAGLILFVIDGSVYEKNPSARGEDRALLEEFKDRPVIIVANKDDLAGKDERDAVKKEFDGHRIEFISALCSTGLERLRDAIYEKAVGHSRLHERESGEIVATLRHRVCLEKALEVIERAADAFKQGLPAEIVAADLRYALDRLGEITGETTTEDILEKIFSGFCIGK